jgi:hypothetical protein
MSDLLRPRSATEIVDSAFRLYRLHFGVIATVALIILGPFSILSYVVGGSGGELIERVMDFFMPIVSGATVLIVANVLHEVDVDVSGTFRQLRGKWGSLISISFQQNLLILVGFVCLVVPGVLALVWTFAAPMVTIVEGGRQRGTAFDRARQLVRGQFWHTLAALGLSALAIFVLFVSAMFAVSFLAGLVHIGEATTNFVSNALFILLYPIFAISSGLLYFDLRIRTEAYDVERLAQILEISAPIAASSPTNSTLGTPP